MATLTNNIRAQNIIDRFADYVTYTANANIIWGTNSYPFAEWDRPAEFGGDTNGSPIAISGAAAPAGTKIDSAALFNYLLAETFRYTNIRLFRAVLFVTGGGGNTGSRGSPGVIFDSTNKSHLAAGYRATTDFNAVTKTDSLGGGDITTGSIIKITGLENFFDRLRSLYLAYYNATIFTGQVEVCHASCHSNCHSSRTRR